MTKNCNAIYNYIIYEHMFHPKFHFCLSNVMLCIEQNIKSRKCPSIRPTSVDKIVTLFMD